MQRPYRLLTLWRLVMLALLGVVALVGCDTGIQSNAPVFVVATPVPADAGFVSYTHPTGAFSLRTPPGWIAGELPDPNGVRVQFTTLEDNVAVTRLGILLVNTGQPMTPEVFAQAANAYQPPADVASYEWQEIERADQRDGSRRIIGIRRYPNLGPRTLNIFLQGDGSFFSALEVDITGASQPVIDQLAAVINTYRVHTDAELRIGTVQQAAASVTSSSGVIAFNGYFAWTDREGVFHLTGEAVNTTPDALEAVRLSGVLYDTQGRRLAEQSDILALDVLGPGQAVPFDLRFEGGRPATAARYELNAAARQAEYALESFYGPENFVIANDTADYTAQNVLVVRGQLANTGPKIAQAVKVIAALWDGEGHIVAAQTLFITQPQIVPQEAVGFEIPFYMIGGPALTYTLIVAGTAASP